MKEVEIKTEYIPLGKLLKYVSAVDSGAIAKIVIKDGLVLVNGEVETRRGKKLYDGDTISYDHHEYLVKHVD